MKEIGKMGVVQYVSGGQGVEAYLKFASDWVWFGSEDFQAILIGEPNLSKIGGCV